ncbi:hypothetical protein EYB26_009868 [Talaromyces marneffei]|uniref:uncharacterized protein n=1 Tax=Talaromyces marneffei TaxID=37727 RepID=UPI0012A80D31|nr:uncharacterized protein EYB26_009868 [Talaromyces marneffei]QGA22154.1 hypothetical protein EYB26_009868 [Talaromyces marneffei]
MMLWGAGQPINLKRTDKMRLAKALWEEALHNQDMVSDTDAIIWSEEEVKKYVNEHGYNFTRICRKVLNCDLSGDEWDPMGYIRIHGSEAWRVAMWKACGLEPPPVVEQEPAEIPGNYGAWERTAKRVSENQGR